MGKSTVGAYEASSGDYDYSPSSTGGFQTCASGENTNREADAQATEIPETAPMSWTSPLFEKVPQVHGPYASTGLFLEHIDEPETPLVVESPGCGTIQGSAKGIASSLQVLHEELITQLPSEISPLLSSEISPLLPVEQQQTFVDTLLWFFWEYVLPPRARSYLVLHRAILGFLALSFSAVAIYLLHRSGNSRLASVIVLSVMCGLEMILWGRDELRVCSSRMRNG